MVRSHHVALCISMKPSHKRHAPLPLSQTIASNAQWTLKATLTLSLQTQPVPYSAKCLSVINSNSAVSLKSTHHFLPVLVACVRSSFTMLVTLFLFLCVTKFVCWKIAGKLTSFKSSQVYCYNSHNPARFHNRKYNSYECVSKTQFKTCHRGGALPCVLLQARNQTFARGVVRVPRARVEWRHRRGGVWEGYPLPNRLGGLGERRDQLSQRGLGRSPSR